MTLTLAGEVEIDIDDAAAYLVNGYNATTIRYYDCGASSLPGEVTTDDIGRMTVFAAQLTYQQADDFLERGNEKDAVSWPSSQLELLLDAPAEDDASFIESAEFRAASSLFRSLMGDRWALAQTSKLLHLKWPNFFPVIDSGLRSVYGAKAVELHNEHFRGGERRRSRASSVAPEAYWLAVRHDLLDGDNVRGLRALRTAVRKVSPSGSGGNDARHRKRVAGLTSLRLLDMLAWQVARERASS